VALPDGGPAPSIPEIFDLLHARYGGEPWHWSPPHARGPMDVICGAVLVQHTAWPGAERALEALRDATSLDPAAIAAMPDDELAALIAMSGTPRVKARRLRAMADTIIDEGGLDGLFVLPDAELRQRLLATHGIGPETADAIMLYAAGRRTFVVDAYARRVFGRLGIAPADGDGYGSWQRMFASSLPDAGAEAFGRHHAHIVLHAKATCRPRPRCEACALSARCARRGIDGYAGQQF
jgi:endonuclease-3 related protein